MRPSAKTSTLRFLRAALLAGLVTPLTGCLGGGQVPDAGAVPGVGAGLAGAVANGTQQTKVKTGAGLDSGAPGKKGGKTAASEKIPGADVMKGVDLNPDGIWKDNGGDGPEVTEKDIGAAKAVRPKSGTWT